jgi:hypothetical protein
MQGNDCVKISLNLGISGVIMRVVRTCPISCNRFAWRAVIEKTATASSDQIRKNTLQCFKRKRKKVVLPDMWEGA